MRIQDGQARAIAADWNGGPRSALSTLATCGAIIDPQIVRDEITQNLLTLPQGEERRPLLALDRYVRETGVREPVRGWYLYWDDETPIGIENV